jgi:hypothetical protein
VRAGEIAAQAISENPDWPDEICQQVPWLTQARIYEFQKIGLKKIHPRLMLCDLPGVRALRRLPYATQEKHVSEPVELLISNGETLRVDIHNLTPDQAAQAFDRGGVRTIPAQRAWLEDKATQKAEPATIQIEPYTIKRGLVKFNEPGLTLDRKALLRILSEME